MTITEFAILVFKSPPDFSDPILQPLFRKLSVWQSDCSGYPLRFFMNRDEPREVYLVTGWTSVEAHEAWIRGERNQELLRVFGPYVDIPRVRMVHIGVDFEAIPITGDAGEAMIVERYEGAHPAVSTAMEEEGYGYGWSLIGRDLARDGDVFWFGSEGGGKAEWKVGGAPVERWVLQNVSVDL